MTNQRAPGKVMIGAQVNDALNDGIETWVDAKPRRTKTDFLLEAIVEKLKREGIQFDEGEALARHYFRRGRKPRDPLAQFSAGGQALAIKGAVAAMALAKETAAALDTSHPKAASPAKSPK